MSNQDKKQFEGLEQAQSPSDIMLWALLEDFVQAKSPPDLKPKIISSLASDAGRNPDRQAELDRAIQSASKDISQGYGTAIPPPVALVQRVNRELGAWVRAGVMVVATLAAAVAAAFFLPNAIKPWNSAPNKSEIAKEKIHKDSNEISPAVAMDKSLKIRDEKPTQISDLERAALESIATDVDKPKSQTPSPTEPQLPKTSIASNAMRDSDIVSVIDNQMNYLWQRVGIVPAAEVPIDVWLDRIAMTVLGRQATAAEKEVFRSNKGESKSASYVDGLVSSGEFARYWSSRLAEHYLGKRLREARDLASPENLFVEWLEQAMARQTFVGTLEREMIAGKSNPIEGSDFRKDASAYWLSETMERAASVQKELTGSGSLVKKRELREESLIGVSRQLMRLSGNPSLVCLQCHVDETSSSDFRGYVAMANTKSSAGSNSFWKVPANLSGLNLVYRDSQRSLRVETPKDYFYEDAEGRMKMARAGPPSLLKQASGSESLGAWFGDASEPRRALIDMVWNQVFQQPLVPAMGLTDAEGLNERVDLRDLLASQIQLRNADLGTLVRWIVLSKAMRLEGLKTDSPWYLKSTESQIASTQKQMRIFASYPRIESIQVNSGKLPVGKVASWIEQKRSFQKPDAMLAQGSNTIGTNKGPKSLMPVYSEDQVRYLISVEEPYSQVKALSDRWAKSSMAWTMLVEHAYLATDARFPTGAEREEANKLLDTAGKDRMRTLVMIVNARLGSW